MDILEKKFHSGINHGGDPADTATRMFQSHDFGDTEILDFDGAYSTYWPGCPEGEAAITFYAAPEDGEGDSVAMKYVVEFSRKGAWVGVYVC